MTTPLYCLLGFGTWTVLLVLAVVVWRTGLVLAGKAAPNAFPSGSQHGTDTYWRLNRAHMNAAENLPLIAAVVLVGTLAGVSTALFSTLAQVYLAARIVQSLLHISSNASLVVNPALHGPVRTARLLRLDGARDRQHGEGPERLNPGWRMPARTIGLSLPVRL